MTSSFFDSVLNHLESLQSNLSQQEAKAVEFYFSHLANVMPKDIGNPKVLNIQPDNRTPVANPSIKQILRETFSEIEVGTVNLASLTEKDDNSTSAVICTNGVHWVSESDYQNMLNQAHRILVLGGVASFITLGASENYDSQAHNPLAIMRQDPKYSDLYTEPPFQGSFYTLEKYHEMLIQAGFNLENIEIESTLGNFPIKNKSGLFTHFSKLPGFFPREDLTDELKERFFNDWLEKAVELNLLAVTMINEINLYKLVNFPSTLRITATK